MGMKMLLEAVEMFWIRSWWSRGVQLCEHIKKLRAVYFKWLYFMVYEFLSLSKQLPGISILL